jgi:hypothetical protein
MLADAAAARSAVFFCWPYPPSLPLPHTTDLIEDLSLSAEAATDAICCLAVAENLLPKNPWP